MQSPYEPRYGWRSDYRPDEYEHDRVNRRQDIEGLHRRLLAVLGSDHQRRQSLTGSTNERYSTALLRRAPEYLYCGGGRNCSTVMTTGLHDVQGRIARQLDSDALRAPGCCGGCCGR